MYLVCIGSEQAGFMLNRRARRFHVGIGEPGEGSDLLVTHSDTNLITRRSTESNVVRFCIACYIKAYSFAVHNKLACAFLNMMIITLPTFQTKLPSNYRHLNCALQIQSKISTESYFFLNWKGLLSVLCRRSFARAENLIHTCDTLLPFPLLHMHISLVMIICLMVESSAL